MLWAILDKRGTIDYNIKKNYLELALWYILYQNATSQNGILVYTIFDIFMRGLLHSPHGSLRHVLVASDESSSDRPIRICQLWYICIAKC